MSYNPNIPFSTDDPKVSQGQILGNFGKANSDFDVNHYTFTQAINAGFHRLVQFRAALAVDPNQNDPISSLYTKTVAGKSELFFQNGNLGTDVYQMTALPVTTVGTNYSVTTPWKLQIQMGTSAASPVTFSNPFPLGTVFLTSQATNVNGTQINVTGTTITQMTYVAVGGTIANYLVIGKIP